MGEGVDKRVILTREFSSEERLDHLRSRETWVWIGSDPEANRERADHACAASGDLSSL